MPDDVSSGLEYGGTTEADYSSSGISQCIRMLVTEAGELLLPETARALRVALTVCRDETLPKVRGLVREDLSPRAKASVAQAPDRMTERLRDKTHAYVTRLMDSDHMPWDALQQSVAEIMVGQLSRILPDAERDGVRAAFAAEMSRLDRRRRELASSHHRGRALASDEEQCPSCGAAGR